MSSVDVSRWPNSARASSSLFDVGVEAVALVGQLLHQHVVVVAHPEAHGDELDAEAGVGADAVEDLGGIGGAHVRDAVRREDHAVDPVLAEGGARELVAEREACLGVRGAARLQRVDGGEDPVGVPRRRGLEDDLGVRAELDDRDGIPCVEAVDEQGEGLLHEAQPVLAGHRARGVDDEREGGVGPLGTGDLARLDADPEQHLVVGEERRRAAVADDRERPLRGWRVVLVEGVDELLDADRGRIGEVPVVDVALGDRVRRGVDVEREGGLPVALGGHERVDPGVLVGDAVVRRRRRVVRRIRRLVRRQVVVLRALLRGHRRDARARAGGRPERDGGEEENRSAHGATSRGERCDAAPVSEAGPGGPTRSRVGGASAAGGPWRPARVSRPPSASWSAPTRPGSGPARTAGCGLSRDRPA